MIIRPRLHAPVLYELNVHRLIYEPSWRWLHPHNHRSVILRGLLDGVPFPVVADVHDAAEINSERERAEAAFQRGEPVSDIVLALAPSSRIPEVRRGVGILLAARALEADELSVTIVYDSFIRPTRSENADPRLWYTKVSETALRILSSKLGWQAFCRMVEQSPSVLGWKIDWASFCDEAYAYLD